VSRQESTAGAASGVPAQGRRRCVRFGCLEPAAWRRPQGGELPACEVDLDVIFNDALARVPPDSGIRVEVWRP
jgi:hypothetical protein